jgi:hypothetical protein
MKKKNDNTAFKIVGLVGAVFLVAFGNFHNFWRTVKLGLGRLNKQKK